MYRKGLGLTVAALLCLALAGIAIPFFPAGYVCLGQGVPTPTAAVLCAFGVLMAGLFGIGSVVAISIEPDGRFQSAFAVALGCILTIAGGAVVVAILAIPRMKHWDCAGG